MRISSLVFTVCLIFASVQGYVIKRFEPAIPSCSLGCLSTIVIDYCGSLTNNTCTCHDDSMMAAFAPCLFTSCNITDLLSMQKYRADLCNIPRDRSRVRSQILSQALTTVFDVIFAAARIASRLHGNMGLGADDWMMLVAQVAFFGDLAAGMRIPLLGFGEHTYDLSVQKVSEAFKFFYIAGIIYFVVITATKLSVLLFFRRIFPERKLQRQIWAMFIFVCVSNFALIMAVIFQCSSLSGIMTNWMYKVPPVKCIDDYAASSAAAGLSILHDLMIMALPIPTLWGLQLSWQKRLHLLAMFSFGIFTVLCSILRIPSLMNFRKSTDPSYDEAPVALWSRLEMSVGLICANLPMARSLIGQLWPKFTIFLFSSTASKPARSSHNELSKHVRKFSQSFSGNKTGMDGRPFIELDNIENKGGVILEESREGPEDLEARSGSAVKTEHNVV